MHADGPDRGTIGATGRDGGVFHDVVRARDGRVRHVEHLFCGHAVGVEESRRPSRSRGEVQHASDDLSAVAQSAKAKPNPVTRPSACRARRPNRMRPDTVRGEQRLLGEVSRIELLTGSLSALRRQRSDPRLGRYAVGSSGRCGDSADQHVAGDTLTRRVDHSHSKTREPGQHHLATPARDRLLTALQRRPFMRAVISA